MGIALLVTVVLQILHDGRNLEMENLKNFKSTTK